MKKGLVGVLRALGVLVGIWAVLGAVGLVAGVLPLDGEGASAAGADRGEPSANDGGVDEPAPTAGRGGPEAADGGPADAAQETTAVATPEAQALDRWTVCDAAVRRPSLGAVQVVGGPAPELAVGCDGVVHLIAVTDGRPARIATFDAERTEDAPLSTNAGVPAAGDVDGDGRPDLVLPFWKASRDGSARGGALYLVRTDATGAFADPRLLGPIAAVAVAVEQLDGRPGLDVVAMNRGSALARRPSEAWVYGGGAVPARTAVLRTGLGAEALALADLDRDTNLDVIAAVSGQPRVDVFFGDGTGRFPRNRTLTIVDATEVLAADLDSDGGTDALVRGEGLHVLHAGPVESLEPRPVDVPEGLTQVRTVDANGDGRPDLVGLLDGGLVVLTQGDDLAFAEGSPRRASPLVMQRLALADLDGDGEPEAAALGRTGGEETAWELVVLASITGERPLVAADAPSPLPDAPLVLRVPLD